MRASLTRGCARCASLASLSRTCGQANSLSSCVVDSRGQPSSSITISSAAAVATGPAGGATHHISSRPIVQLHEPGRQESVRYGYQTAGLGSLKRAQACLPQAAGSTPCPAHRPFFTTGWYSSYTCRSCSGALSRKSAGGTQAGSTVATCKACAPAPADQPLPASHLSAAAASTCAARRWRPRRCTTRRSTRAPQSRKTLRRGEAAADLQGGRRAAGRGGHISCVQRRQLPASGSGGDGAGSSGLPRR